MAFRGLGPVLLAASLGMALPRVSLAAPAGADEAFVETSNDLRRRGQALFKKKEYTRAYAAFVAAWALKQHWALAGDLAHCELKLGLYRDAAEHFEIFLRGKEAEGPPLTDAVLEPYFEARSKVGALDVSVTDDRAEVLLDGKSLGWEPFEDPLYVEPGQHTVTARFGDKTKTAVFEVKAGQVRRIVLALGTMPGEVPVAIIDNEWQGWDGADGKTSSDVPEAPGTAKATAAQDGRAAPAAPPQEVVTRHEGKPNMYLVWGGAGAGAVAVGTGVALALLSGAKASDADELLAELRRDGARCSRPPQPGGCTELLSLREEQGTFANVAVSMFVAGAVLWTATAAYTFWPRPDAKPATAVRMIPVVTPYETGLSIGGAF